MKNEYVCAKCGVKIYRYPSQTKGRKHLFCSMKCLSEFQKRDNPDRVVWKRPDTSERNRINNANIMTPEVKEKLRLFRLGKGEGKGYAKTYGRHTHRLVAEQKLGRPLEKGEVVHHIDGNKRNNDPNNLMVFASQREHAKWHQEHKEVMPNEVPTP